MPLGSELGAPKILLFYRVTSHTKEPFLNFKNVHINLGIWIYPYCNTVDRILRVIADIIQK